MLSSSCVSILPTREHGLLTASVVDTPSSSSKRFLLKCSAIELFSFRRPKSFAFINSQQSLYRFCMYLHASFASLLFCICWPIFTQWHWCVSILMWLDIQQFYFYFNSHIVTIDRCLVNQIICSSSPSLYFSHYLTEVVYVMRLNRRFLTT